MRLEGGGSGSAGPAAQPPGTDRSEAEAEGVRVRTHPGLCAGMGNCHRWAPEVYPLDDEGYVDVHMLAVPAELAEQAWRGASVCPERAITVIGPPEEYWIRRRQQATEERR